MPRPTLSKFDWYMLDVIEAFVALSGKRYQPAVDYVSKLENFVRLRFKDGHTARSTAIRLNSVLR